jgi:hypothetical protein
MATATGSIVTADDIWGGSMMYLLTNWHVLTGRNSFDGSWLSAGRAYPRFLDVRLCDRDGAPHCIRLDLWFTDEDEPTLGRWYELWRPTVTGDLAVYDAAALPIRNALAEVDVVDTYVGTFNGRPDIHPLGSVDLHPMLNAWIDIGDQVVLAAYPRGFRPDSGRASLLSGLVSSDLFGWTTLTLADGTRHTTPGFLVDTSGAISGCSGALVYLYDDTWLTRSGFTVSSTERVAIPLGIYTGRVDNRTRLGRVLHIAVVTELLQRGQPTEIEWE